MQAGMQVQMEELGGPGNNTTSYFLHKEVAQMCALGSGIRMYSLELGIGEG
jgi:hypothetical protein